jgi:flagellar motor switch protein FliG
MTMGAAMSMPAAPGMKAAEFSEEDKAAMKRQEEERELEYVRKDVVRGLAARPDLARQLVRDWQTQPKNLIALLQAFGTSVSRQTLMPHLDRAGYSALEDATRTEKPVDRGALTKTLREASLFLVTQELAQPEEIRPDPFVFLGEMSRGQIAHLVKDEPVRVKAIVLSRIAPEDMAHILESYPKEMQLEVAVQIGNFHALPLDAVSDIARNLAEKASKVPDGKTVDIEGPKALVDLMSRASTGTIRYLLDAMKAKDRKLSAEIEKRFFLFDAIPMVPEEALPQVVRRLPSQVVLQAIQGSDPALQRKVIMAFPEQARTGMVTSLRGARFDAKTVMEARQQVVERFQQAAAEGRIDLKAVISAWQDQAKAS